MKNIALCAAFLAAFSYAEAKTGSIVADYDWNNAPVITALTEDELKESQLYVKDVQAIEYYVDEEIGFIFQNILVHKLVHLNDGDAVDNFNKISFPAASYTEFITRKARVIKKDGSVINLKDKDIIPHTEGGYAYDYFALEGIEVGDEVEFLYSYKSWPSMNGRLVPLQDEHVPKRECTYTIIAPEELEFKVKSYNGFPELVRDSSYEDVIYLTATYHNMPKFKEEKYASTDANLAYIIFRLEKNNFRGEEIDPYPDFAKSIANTFGEIDPAKVKIKKLVKEAEIEEGQSDEEKLRLAENYIKDNYSSSSYSSDVKEVIKKKEGSEYGMLKTYATLFRYLDIKYELVYTTDRSEFKFDPEFDCTIFLQEVLFYFPRLDMYMAPFSQTSRLGLPPMFNTANPGLFVKFIELNETFTGYSTVKMIEPLPADRTTDKLEVEVSFEELPVSKVKVDRELTGYAANSEQVLYDYMNDEDKKEIEEAFVKFIDEDMEISDIEVVNLGIGNVVVKPIRINATFTSEGFVSKAGDNYLISVGRLIGPQGEMYNEAERRLPVENYYNHTYKRTIVVHIPEGFEISDETSLEILSKNVSFTPEGAEESDIGFISTYKVEGNKIIIEIEEYYKTIHFDLERYQEFKDVINAAADFNKIQLLIKKAA